MNPISRQEQLPNKIILPPIQVAYTHSLGAIYHLIDLGGERTIERVEEINLTLRTKVKVYILSDGQRIIVSERKIRNRPTGTNGVLDLSTGPVPRWTSHEKIEQFNEERLSKGFQGVASEITDSWINGFSFVAERKNERSEVISRGLRPPQIGGLHAIGAHWSLYNQPATIVMPTGTGKTETMLATLLAYRPGRVLVVVPSRILRQQITKKFIGLGLLRYLGTVGHEVRNPIVGVLEKRPRTIEDLSMFEQCNVIVATMSALGTEIPAALVSKIVDRIDTLIVDEAHHVAATTWSAFREKFQKKRIIQFTATPYRRDGKLVDGKVIFNYPLHAAQQDGYFKPITFEPVYEIDEEEGDKAIARAAVEKLRQDLVSGYDHLMMARCENIDRAAAIHQIYLGIAPDLKPIIVHSEKGNVSHELNKLLNRESRIVVCVNMLGEGFDLPQLKIAAVHDTHKSLAVLLQFTGRFTRTAASDIGNATVFANIANQEVSSALERLYSEDADWNHLLSEISSEAARAHAALIDFLNQSERVGELKDDDIEISHHLLRPSFGTLIYKAESFLPEKFYEAIPKGVNVHRVWIHHESKTLYFVTSTNPYLQWTRSRDLHDRQWDLFVVHYNEEQGLLFLSSSNKDSNFEGLAKAVGATQMISGEVIFRCLGHINRLIFQNVGVRKHGRRNLSFAMYTGSDVAQALSITERGGSVKSNLSGSGWEEGEPVTIACSLKGRIWSRDAGAIPELIAWCKKVGAKVLDESIDMRDVIANVLIPQTITQLPDLTIINIDWPIELLRQTQERVLFKKGTEDDPISMFGIEIVRSIPASNQIDYKIYNDSDDPWATFTMTISEEHGFKVERSSSEPVEITIGRLNMALEDYFSDYPPIIRFVDLSELDGNLLIRPQETEELVFPEEQLNAWNWSGVDITKESMWKGSTRRSSSIQGHVAEYYRTQGYDVLFDDDAAGESADLVCLKEEDDNIRLVLVHCKFTTSPEPGERIKDVVEVCSQAIRSAKWKWKFKDLCNHIAKRERKLATSIRPTRFLAGSASDLNKFIRANKFKEVKAEIVIVQPGYHWALILLTRQQS